MATTGRVLLVGKRAQVLDRLADALRAEGLQVRQETDLDRIRTHVDVSTVDVLALGRAVTGARREELVAALRARNPALRVVDGLAPITPLLVAQIQEALTAPGMESRIVAAAGVEVSDRSVAISLRRPADVTVVYHRLDSLYRAHEQLLHSGPLGRGHHWFPVKGTVTRGERFLVVRADRQTTVHQLV
ncbi:MAG: hypothetical protein ACRDVN_07740 [Jiangellaceae bacterium]